MKDFLLTTNHEVEGAFTGLSYAGRHATFECLCTHFGSCIFQLYMNLRREGGAVNKEFSG